MNNSKFKLKSIEKSLLEIMKLLVTDWRLSSQSLLLCFGNSVVNRYIMVNALLCFMCFVANADKLYLDYYLSSLVLVDVTFSKTKLVVTKYDVVTLSFSMLHF